MALASMTGFARAAGTIGGLSWTWEVKSVNGRSLDMRFRMPGGYDALEAPARALVSARLKRGNVTCNLQLAEEAAPVTYRLNEPLLAQLGDIANDVAVRFGAAPPTLDGLLSLRGVMEVVEQQPSEEDREAREAALIEGLRQAIDGLIEVRAVEGRHLQGVLSTLLGDMASLAAEAKAAADSRPEAWRTRLSEQVAALLGSATPLPEERLAQELAIIIAKGDIREELDRLAAHLAASHAAMKKDDPGGTGRRLDFLAQELNREANTLCSKSGDAELTRIGLELKLAIDRFREQAANIE